LKLDPGMHTAVVRRVAVDASCSLLATASEDKTIKLWRIPSGRLLRTLRPPIGEGNNGRVYAVAMPPDASWVAAGGWNRTGGDHYVFIFDPESGAIMTRFGPFEVIDHLSVSRDGRFLAAALRNGQGLRVWEHRADDQWRLVGKDDSYKKGDLKGLSFGPANKLYTVAHDGNIRLYASDYSKPEKISPTRAGRRPYSISVHPDGNSIAVGFNDSIAVEVYDTGSLASRALARPDGVLRGAMSAVTWSSDGKHLYAGGTFKEHDRYAIARWASPGAGPPTVIGGAKDTLLHLLPCGEGIAAAAGDPAFGVLGQHGERILWHDPIAPDMRGKLREHFLVAPDGMRVRFGLEQGGEDPVLLDLRDEQIREAPSAPHDLLPALNTGLPIENWENSGGLTYAERQLRLDRGERSQSMAIAPGGDHFVIGSDYNIQAYDKDGVFLWRRHAPGIIWGVNIVADGRLLVAAAGDGTVRWYRMIDGRELLAFFVDAKNMRWVAWTPQGYFTASLGGESMVGWHVNRGWAEAGDFFPIAKFRSEYYRPDIVRSILAHLDEDMAIEKANSALQRERDKGDLKQRLPPIVRIVSPADHTEVSGDELLVEVAVRSPSGSNIKRLFAQVDGQLAGEGLGSGMNIPANVEVRANLNVKLASRGTNLTVMAETEHGTSEPARIVIVRPDASAEPAIKPRLFVLAVGVGDYSSEKLKLGEFPKNDVVDFTAELRKQEGPLFETVEIKVLADGDATQQQIIRGLGWLRKAAATPEDIALFYFSGHGATVPGGASFLLPVDYDPEAVFETAVDKSRVLNVLKNINARVLFFVDACYAGEGLQLGKMVGIGRLDAMGIASEFSATENGGIIAFASSNGREQSYGEGRNSYFTKALIESLRGQGPRLDDRFVVTDDINFWLRRQVPRLSGGRQTPFMMSSPYAKPIPIAAPR
jgi:hypothetical protein